MQRGNHGSRLYAWLTLLAILFASKSSFAIPEAHILRIDPRAGVAGGAPLLTTVVEVVETRSMSDVVTSAGCGQATGDAMLDCISNAVEAKNAMFKPFQFPDSGANLMVRVDGTENLAKMESKGTWGSMAKDPLVGTAWLIGLDASSNMGPRYADAREVANQMISALGPNDVAKLIIFDDRVQPFVQASAWVPSAQKATLIGLLAATPNVSVSHGRQRPLFNTIKNITKAFGELGNVGTTFTIPMHQTMVLLSNGSGREDASNSAVSAEGLKQFFNKGRFPEDNVLAPKTPLPVISVYFPNARGFVNDQFATNDMQFMQDLSNPEIGGFFDIVRTNQGVTKATAILGAVKNRFNQMWVVKWRLACLASTAEQTFNLVFSGQGAQAVKPDGSFREVPIGVDPTSWPLDIDMALTKAEADANPIHPGGTIKIFGNFCWAGDKNRAEAYFVPAGTNPNQNVNRNDPAIARKAMQQIQAQGLHGTAEECSATHVVIKVPDEEKLLEGEGDNAIARLVLYDNKAQRASGVTPETVVTLKAGKKPLNLPIILGAAGIVVVILLLVVVLLRGGGGGGGRKKGGAPPPQPIVAGGMPGPPPGYGAPPGGGYGGGAPPYGGGGPPPGGGGYGAAPPDPAPPPMQAVVPVMAPVVAAPPPIQPLPPPPLGGGGYPLAVAGGAPVEVRCPACSMATLVVPGQAGVCFSCGQPLPRDIASSGAVAAPAAAPAFPLTSAIAAQPLAPPPNPYGHTPTSATIVGAAGTFAIAGGVEVRIGRDPAACAITLQEPRVSGIHATLKFEAGQLFVRDEGSNNGTHVAGSRIAAATWTSVPQGAQLRFGPVDFTVRFEG